MQNTTNNNAVTFLLDGNEFFRHMHRSLNDLIANGVRGQANCYVRFAYWMIANTLTLPGYGGGGAGGPGPVVAASPFTTVLQNIANAGHHVQIIAWAGNPLMVDHDWLETWVNQTNATAAATHVVGYTPIQLYQEEYGGDMKFCSNHQKIALISINGAKEALVGGFNISGGYLSSHLHNNANYWHDTGVSVTGPAVDDIEGEWVRRWNKQPANGPAPNNAIGPAQGNAGNLTIRTCTNNIEATPPEADIRTQLCQRIRNANNLVYLENYALTDPFVVRELARRVRGVGGPAPQVIAVVDNPTGITAGMKGMASYLMYYTFLELSLPNLASIDIIDGIWSRLRRQPRTVAVAAMAGQQVTANLGNPAQTATFNPATGYRFNFTEGGTQRSIDFADIWGYTPGPNANVMYSLANGANTRKAYPHSKLAIFDDDYLVVGTSNWTYRSMQYDGEITLFIHDNAGAPNFVTAARDRLFQHWNQPNNPALWNATAVANQAGITGGTIVNQDPRIVPLGFDSFLHPSSQEAWTSGFTWLGYGSSAIF